MSTLIEARNVHQDAGWFKAEIGDVQFVYMDSLADTAHARFIAWMREDLRALVPGRRRGVLYEVTDRVRLSNAQRSQISSLFREKNEELRAVTSGYALVTPSLMVRGMLTTLYWFAPPPYPYCIEPTLDAALQFLSARQPSIDADTTRRSYDAVKYRLGY